MGEGIGVSTPQPPWGPPGPDPRDWRAAPPPSGGPAWDQLFELDDARRPVARQQNSPRGPKLVLGAIALVVVVVIAAVVGWLVTRDSNEHSSAPTSSVSPTPSVDPEVAQAQSRLSGLLPAGYSPGSCEPTEPPPGGLAAVSCKQNTDAGGPVAATFTLGKDKAALDSALGKVIGSSTAVECPGRIQSPGPWRRNATPQQVSGTLFCGYVGRQPVVAWSDVAKLLVGEVRGGADRPPLTELYRWWSSHS
jgi:hypothetical protein